MWFSIHRALFALALSGAMLVSLPAKAFCFNEAGARYRVDPSLLRAIAQVESGMKPGAIGKNMSGKKLLSRDLGLMQINDRHVPQLRAMGILNSEQDLLNNPCLNVQIGAWILAKHLQQCGVNWECLGSYNAGFAKDNSPRRMIYARKIYSMYLKSRGDGS
ncbi:lytic transglycosylase domain-containing protein [Yokenella regensburgei]|uniref:lytic transglycosylase domain-containing protein n=1 Tax=Enterobacteriaceae TaxID=543 RepID=UPI0024A7C65F|nr:lytic transglycosylase domain-containing protein [Klebsiella pneumoniae]HDO7154530.1 lytic transglycosylase domain-containing protein [Klebsiella pneumoniae]